MIEQTDREGIMPVVTESGDVDVRETVFQVWCMMADRSPTRTAEIVAREFALHVSPDLVRKWSTRHGWNLKARELFEDVAPDYFERTRAALVAAGPAAAGYLRDVNMGLVEAKRDNVVAAVAALDRIGFLPHTRREAEKGHSPIARSGSGDHFGELSDEELRAIVAGRVQSLGSVEISGSRTHPHRNQSGDTSRSRY